MTTTAAKRSYNPSVNIIRDFHKDLNYVPTSNARKVFDQIASEFVSARRSFTIVGAYGTGKSSFLWAVDKVLNGRRDYFELPPSMQEYRGFRVINIVGQYASLIHTFQREFQIDEDLPVGDIIKTLDKEYKKCKKKHQGLVLCLDEFGKFLEFAAKVDPEQELYFIQQLTEYANDPDKDILLISTLHQEFGSYAYGLSKAQRNEWSKVKGRWCEITFNEPVEQLLYLASERLSENLYDRKKYRSLKSLHKTIEQSKLFPLRDYLSLETAERLLPLDILAASVLTLALQKYGQNERSLFSFLESSDRFGLRGFEDNGTYFNLSQVCDYLLANFPILHTKYNPHHTQWLAIKNSLEKVEGIFSTAYDDHLKLVKTIGLLGIFGSKGSLLDASFLDAYGRYSLGIKNVKTILKDLEKKKLIRYVRHNRRYILFEGTDLDIELAIDEAGNLVEQVYGVVNYLNTYFDFPCILAKSFYYRYGTPRFFQFELSESPVDKVPKGEIDGFVNLIFAEDVSATEVQHNSLHCKEAIVFGLYNNSHDIRHLIFEIQKIEKVIENNPEDRVALRELKSIHEHQIKLLNHYVLESIYSDQSAITWFFAGEEVSFSNAKEFNRLLSRICETVYHGTPIYKSELVNKTKLSAAIATAQKKLIQAVHANWMVEDLGFSKSTFPPEKAIYLSLVKETGLLRLENEAWGFRPPSDETFAKLWQTSENFLQSSKASRRNLGEFIDVLLTRPLKLKRGFVDFWLPLFLLATTDDYALYEKDVYIPYVTPDVLELVTKSPRKYYIKSFDLDGINLQLFQRYRALLNQEQVTPSSQGFIDTVRPFLTFYRKLPPYTKGTRNLSKGAINLRRAIARATSPEKIFFEDFPAALGYEARKLAKNETLLEEYFTTLQSAIKELRGAQEELLQRFEASINSNLGLPENDRSYRDLLMARYGTLNVELLPAQLSSVVKRLRSDLDRDAWLGALAQSCVGSNLQNLKDAAEPLLYERFAEITKELDTFCQLSNAVSEEESALSIEITEPQQGVRKRVIRLPKSKEKNIAETIEQIRQIMGDDRQLNMAVVTLLLKQLLDE